MSVDTLGVRFSAEGSENILSLIKQITTATGQLDTELKKLESTSKQASSGIGPAFSNLGNAISAGEGKITSLKQKFTEFGGVLARQATSFGTATASVWGIYNAYDSLEKVQLRASQSTVRVETLTTSLRSQEEQLRLARESGNLTAEQVAVKEERIIDTKQKLTVAQERERVLTEDVSEAWAGFASLVGPQVIAAAGSITQSITALTAHAEGQLSVIGRMRGGFSSLVNTFGLARSSGLALNSTFAQMPIFAGAAEVGVRGLSGAIKGLLIGTGIGAVLVAIGLLTEGFGLLSETSAQTAEKTKANFEDAAAGPDEFTKGIQADLDLATKIIEKFTADEKKALEEGNIAFIDARIQRNQSIALELQTQLNAATAIAASQYKIRDALQKQKDTFPFIISDEDKKRLNDANVAIAASEKVVADLKPAADQARAAITGLAQAKQLLAAADKEAGEEQQKYAESIKNLPQDIQTVVGSVDRWFDSNQSFLVSMNNVEAATAFATNTITGAYEPGTALAAAATEEIKVKLEELFPNMEKLAKETEKTDDTMQKNIQTAKELSQRYGVEVPQALLLDVDALRQFGDALALNDQKVKEFVDRTKFLSDISGLEKAFKIEFDVDKEVKDFIKDLPKDVRKRMKLIIDTQSDLKGVKSLWEIIAPAVFQEGKTFVNDRGETIMRVDIRPEFNNPEDIEGIADTMIESLEDQFGKNPKNPIVAKLISDLEKADTETELKAAFAALGIDISQIVMDAIPVDTGINVGTMIAGNIATGILQGPKATNPQGNISWNPTDPFNVQKNGENGGGDDLGKQVSEDATEAINKWKDASQKAMADVQKTARGFVVTMNTYFAKTMGGGFEAADILITALEKDAKSSMSKIQTTARGFVITMATYFGQTLAKAVDVATASVESLQEAVDSLESKTITVTVKTRVTGPGSSQGSSIFSNVLGGGGVISAAEGKVFTTSGPQLVLIGDNPGGKETFAAAVPHNDPMPAMEAIMQSVFGNGGVAASNGKMSSKSMFGAGSSTVNNMGYSGPIIIQITSPVYIGTEKIAEVVRNESIGNLDRFVRA